MSTEIDLTAAPSGPGCADCTASGGWWFHLRRCAACGTVGCCDSSPGQHARRHSESAGHPIVQSYEPGEDWFYDFRTDAMGSGPELTPPGSHPADQAVPGPADRLPADWMAHLN
ncbi:UBP-type zinc finger domain-containing protein [Nocardiopsis coralliicola]